MKLVIITGPHAVGKMTVGQELERLTGLKLFHNHMTIDIVCELFANMPSERMRLTELFREEIFKSFAKSGEYGMIFTYMWAFDSQEDWDYIEHVKSIFEDAEGEVYFVELEAGCDIRLERNRTENRLANKPSKRDLARSYALFDRIEKKYRLNSLPGEIPYKNYIRIDNSDMEPMEAAELIKRKFAL
ncbi:MAG: shikimate kinase [Christensenellales bacterium]